MGVNVSRIARRGLAAAAAASLAALGGMGVGVAQPAPVSYTHLTLPTTR